MFWSTINFFAVASLSFLRYNHSAFGLRSRNIHRTRQRHNHGFCFFRTKICGNSLCFWSAIVRSRTNSSKLRIFSWTKSRKTYLWFYSEFFRTMKTFAFSFFSSGTSTCQFLKVCHGKIGHNTFFYVLVSVGCILLT